MVTVHPNALQTPVQTGGRGLCKASMDTDPLGSQASSFCSLGLCFLLRKLGGLEQSPRLPPAAMLCDYEVYLSIRRPFGSGGYSLAVSLRSFSSWLPRLVQVYGQVWCCGSLFLCDKIEDTEEFQFLDSRLFGLCTMPVFSFSREVPRTAASDTLFPCCSENCYRLPSVLALVSWAIIVPLLRGQLDSPLIGLLLGDIKSPWGLCSPAWPRAVCPVFLEVHFRVVGGPRRDHHPGLPQAWELMLKEAYCL